MGNLAIYGDMLDAFPELFQQMSFWNAAPKVGGGYSKEQSFMINGILLDTNNNAILRRRFGAGYMLDAENQDILWVPLNSPVEVGMFFYHPQDGVVHRVVASLDKTVPGGFKRFIVERVGGANGTNEEVIPVSGGKFL